MPKISTAKEQGQSIISEDSEIEIVRSSPRNKRKTDAPKKESKRKTYCLEDIKEERFAEKTALFRINE